MSIGNINNIPWYLRLGVFTLLALSFYGGFWYFVTSGTRKETRGLQEQVSALVKANAEAQIASQRLNEFRTAYKNKQEELEELRARVKASYEEQTDIRYGAARGWIDAIIQPHETRDVLMGLLRYVSRPPAKGRFHTGVIQV